MKYSLLLKQYVNYILVLFSIIGILLIWRSQLKEAIPSYSPGNNGIFHFYTAYHYGDNLLNLKFFYNISDILRENNITIHYYYNTEYVKNRDELDRYVERDIVKLHPLEEKPANAVELWMGNNVSHINRVPSMDLFFAAFYQKILTYMGLDRLGIDTSLYQKENYLLPIYDKLPTKFKDVDILFINGEPKSAQFAYNKAETDAICVELSKRYRVVTTSPVNDMIPCTFTDGLKLQDIGAISTHAKYIVGTNTAPLIPCFNSYTKQNVKKWIFVSHENFTEIPYKRIWNHKPLLTEPYII